MNNNYINTITLNQFKNINYELITINELKEIAKSLNISSINDKNEVYKRIEKYLITEDQINKDLILKQENLNSIWSKDKPKLKSTQIINGDNNNGTDISDDTGNDKNELLFWSIFRNKILFKLIFSKLVFKESNSYNEIIGIEYTFNHFNNSLDIIIDKLKSNNFSIIKNKTDIIKLFNIFNNNNDKINQLYNYLFKNYKSPFIQFNDTSTWLNEIIKSHNIVAFNQYISVFNISKESIRELININININNYYAIKLEYYLKENHYLKESQTVHIPNFNNDNIRDIKILSIKFKQLIKLFNYIMVLVYDNNSNNSYTYNNIINKDQYKYNNLISELKQIKITDFTIDNLNSSIRELLINNYNKDLLFKYYKVLFSINKIYNINLMKNKNQLKKPIEYYIYFKNKSKIINSLKLKGGYRIGDNIPSDMALDLYYISCFSNNKKDQLSIYPVWFIKGIHYDTYECIRYCKSIIASNDLDLIKLVSKKPIVNYFRHEKSEGLKSIVKPEIIEYLLNIGVLSKENQTDWVYISNIEVLKHYEHLMQKSLSTNAKPFTIGNSTIKESMEPQILIRAFDEPLLYEFEISTTSFNENFKTISKVLKDKQYREDKFKIIYSIIKTLDLTDLYINNLFDFNSIKYNGDLLNWIFNNYNNNIQKNDYIETLKTPNQITNSNKNYHIYKKDLINYFSYGGKNEDITQFFKYQIECNDRDQINNFPLPILESFIFYCIENKADIYNQIYKTLLVAAKKGYIDIFKSIISKYSFVLKKKNNGNKSNSGILELESLYNIIDTAIKSNNDELAYLLINYIGLDDKKYKLFLNKINKLNVYKRYI